MADASSAQEIEVVGDHRAPHAEDQMTSASPSATSATVMQMVNTVKTSRHAMPEAGEGDEVDVDGVQHQLDAEQDADGVAPRDARRTGRSRTARGERKPEVQDSEAQSDITRRGGEVQRAEQRREEQDGEQLEGSTQCGQHGAPMAA
jgi:hypothetical protein